MYCIKCGVELSRGQEICPLCNTRVYHPDLPVEGAPTYPRKPFQSEEFNRRGLLFVISILWFIPFALPVIFELSWHATVTWSGLVAGGVLLAYILVVLPLWFKHAPPIIFVASDFAAILLYLLYIDIQNHGGRWFLRFAFPVTGVFALICCAVVTLCFYIRRGYLYIFGGASIALGAWTVLIEFLIWVAFGVVSPVFWSACSFASLFVIGMLLIVIAMVKPLKESLKKKFFLG